MEVQEERTATQVPIRDDKPPSMTIVEAVAAATERDPRTCPPLYHAVDSDALDDLLTHDASVRIEFEYAGCDVVVRDGTVAVSTD